MKKLAIAQIVLGILIVLSSVFVCEQGFPLSYSKELPGGIVQHVFINPAPRIITACRIATGTGVMGLAVFGCGIAQFLKARRLKGAKPL